MANENESSLFINRELSWLKFNTRVLSQAQKETNPLLEKLKFLAIYGTNLDEFYMIRVAGLQELEKAGVFTVGPDEIPTYEQLEKIRGYIHEEKRVVESIFVDIIEKLRAEDLHLKEYNELDINLKRTADTYFFSNIFPVIIPIAVDSTHPFPHLNNLSFSLALKLQDIDNEKDTKYAMIRIPRVLPRFIQVADNVYIPIESLIKKHINSIFSGYKLLESSSFRVTRNADILIEEEEAEDFMEILEQGLRQRKKGLFVRLEIEQNTNEDLMRFILKNVKFNEKDIYYYSTPLNLGALWQIVSNQKFAHLSLAGSSPKNLPPFGTNESIFSVIDREDVLIYHPYESFEPITKLIQSAATDPKTLSIRMTLYRVEKNSPLVKALIDAANHGKQVTAMVELKARFDEENNLIWAKSLEDAGAHVVYGIPGFKVHSKVTQIIRQVDGKLKIYMHFGTGNYNGATSKIYTDVSYFTSRKEFVGDSTRFFHNLTGFGKYTKLKNLYMSPIQIKQKLLSMIGQEAKRGSEGRIIAKVNSLVDTDVIKALYRASNAGVQIDLIVRGICALKPGVEGVSENINVISIVGKYLEHARILYFKHTAPHIFISSADWMTRNLDSRIELMIPIYKESLSQKLFEILHLQLKDTDLAWKLKGDESYEKIAPKDEEKALNSQDVVEGYIDRIYKSLKKDASQSKSKILASKLFKEG